VFISHAARLLKFAAVGAVGFVVDAGVLVMLVHWTGVAPLPGRIASFVTAASVTYLLNKRFTFRVMDNFGVDRWLIYVGATAVGAGINVGIYHWWVQRHGDATLHLVLGTAIGSLAAMCVNFLISSRIVFKRAALPAGR